MYPILLGLRCILHPALGVCHIKVSWIHYSWASWMETPGNLILWFSDSIRRCDCYLGQVHGLFWEDCMRGAQINDGINMYGSRSGQLGDISNWHLSTLMLPNELEFIKIYRQHHHHKSKTESKSNNNARKKAVNATITTTQVSCSRYHPFSGHDRQAT